MSAGYLFDIMIIQPLLDPAVRLRLVELATVDAESSLYVSMPQLLRDRQVVFGMTCEPPVSPNITEYMGRHPPTSMPQRQP